MMFVFKNSPDGLNIESISRAQYQISQENSIDFLFNAWGTVEVVAETKNDFDAAIIRKDYELEVMNRISVKDISEIAIDFPGTNASIIGSEQIGSNSTNMTAYGVYFDSIIYRGGYFTRHGAYPFPDSMLLPTQSLSKVMMTSVGAMAFDLAYPSFNFYNRSIHSLIPECPSELWNDSSIDNAIDMATGNYNNDSYEKDYNSNINKKFILGETYKEKLSIACNIYKRRSKPGMCMCIGKCL
jgi:hypothetical protein